MNELNLGDAVRLKSGGPLMTVIFLEGNLVNCTWFVDNILTEAWFPSESLEMLTKL